MFADDRVCTVPHFAVTLPSPSPMTLCAAFWKVLCCVATCCASMQHESSDDDVVALVRKVLPQETVPVDKKEHCVLCDQQFDDLASPRSKCTIFAMKPLHNACYNGLSQLGEDVRQRQNWTFSLALDLVPRTCDSFCFFSCLVTRGTFQPEVLPCLCVIFYSSDVC